MLSADSDAALRDVRKHQHALGSGNQILVVWIEVVELAHCDVHALVDLGLAGRE